MTQEDKEQQEESIQKIIKDFTLEDIENAIREVGLDKYLDTINKAMAIDYKELMKDYKPIVVVDKRVKYYCPNGVEITFNDKGDK